MARGERHAVVVSRLSNVEQPVLIHASAVPQHWSCFPQWVKLKGYDVAFQDPTSFKGDGIPHFTND
jgi:hypothetical protein